MSRHTFYRNKKYSTTDLSDSEDEDWDNSYDNSVSPSGKEYMFGYRASAKEQEEEEDEDLLIKCVDQLHSTINSSNYTEEELIEAVREANYSVSGAIKHLAHRSGNDDLLFGFEESPKKSYAPTKTQPPKAQPAASQRGPSNIASNLNTRGKPNVTGKKVNAVQGTVTATLASTTKAAASGNTKPFDFSSPSPDDIVLQTQGQAFSKKKDVPKAPTGGQKFQGKSRLQEQQERLAKGEKLQNSQDDIGAPPGLTVSTTLYGSTGINRDVARAMEKKQVKQHNDARRTQILKSIKESEESSDSKAHINLVVIGHVDAGKSTLMGHLMVLSGEVSEKTINKYERDAKVIGKGSFHFAWVLDEHAEERERGVTIDVSVNSFQTKTKQITLLDAPGHKDFVPNMISGAAQADVAVLVINASDGEFERGFKDDGQTKEHVVLAKSLGVSFLIVAINKLDSVDWSETRYNELIEAVSPFLRRTGFPASSVIYIPCSGLVGENLTSQNSELLKAWYKGPTLIDAIDQLKPPVRAVENPCRFVVSDVYRDNLSGMGVCVGGKVESGFLAKKDQLLVLPINELCTIKTIKFHNDSVEYAAAGSNIDIGLLNIEMNMLQVGSVLCDPLDPIPLVTSFKAQIITFNPQPPILRGTQVCDRYFPLLIT
eukprot:TRINITY_DN5576_c0_g1_i1.p1 TRINITY_DN5576_c0_g1~~TRINITY_DN5576_c0_g1_i1.p1  ORF type:complete len:656 (-),score=153.87 TRINITY_DN5576_c0_g1_i1:283-2250(-)